MSIGSRLAQEATRREISHQDAADQIGVSQATFSRWVNGTNLPGPPYYTKLARFLRTNRDEIAAAIGKERSTGGLDSRIQARIAAIESEVAGVRGDIAELRELVLEVKRART